LNIRRIACMGAVLFLSIGCTPSTEQIATMTAAAWTPTPVPSPTPTPIPYGLTIHVADESGAGIKAEIVLLESGSTEPVLTDDSGTYTWGSINGPSGTLQISAPGYHPASQPVTLERGLNEVAVFLQRDPLGLAAADACAPEEKLLYIEDFQDGKAHGWAVTAGTPDGWTIVTGDDENRFAALTGIGMTQVELPGFGFDNSVWRLRVQAANSDGQSLLNLKHYRAGADARYSVLWGPTVQAALLRTDPADPETLLASGRLRARPGVWYYIEVSNHQGTLQLWVDGQKEAEYLDTTALAPGTISLESHISADPGMAYYFDNISVCELSEPFSTSLYKRPQ
jgi:hypothetical protein